MNDKQLVAKAAAAYVEDGMIVGLGTGSTANAFIEELAHLQQTGLRFTAVSSSTVSAIKAKALGLPLIALEQVEKIDLYVDGADEISSDLTLLKGRGYDLVREKLLARAADRFIVVADRSKLVERIGERYPIPIEVMPFAWQMVKRQLEKNGGSGELRPNSAGDGLAVTSYGSLVLNMTFSQEIATAALESLLDSIPGIVEHGIFRNLASLVLVADGGKVEVLA